nr:endonuclease VII domain-containing protein [Mycobacteroides abscessus]
MCPKCASTKPVEDFFRNRSQPDGRHSYCKPCAKAYDQEKYPNGKPGKRSRYFKQTYGLSLEEIQLMNAAQRGKCAICGDAPESLVVDHNHETGAVRGLLCNNCNRCLGLLKDNIEVLTSAAAYLIQHEDVLTTVGGGIRG